MTGNRPNPDELLARIQADEARTKRGSLRIFFGYAAGVGKTYAMLKAAQAAAAQGHDVVAGYVEPHSRPETEALLTGLEAIAPRDVIYRNVTMKEFDVDAALARRPEILLVDELAHSNAEGCRHRKRWQDVQECLDHGIDVWTTLNVQHIESLNDVISRITGVSVRETVPDHVFDSADELTLSDITPEDLIARLESGKVYLSEQARRAIDSFFRKANLTALRELSLRQAARRIRSDVESERTAAESRVPWATSERLLVCVGPSPTTARVIRTAKRMATALDAPWLAVAVDLTGNADSPGTRSISEHFRLAERLGAETLTLAGQDVASTILDFARMRNVTKIFIGKTSKPRWRRLLFRTAVDELLETAEEIDVYVIHGEGRPREAPDSGRAKPFRVLPYVLSSTAVALACTAAIGLRRLDSSAIEANSAMIFLASVAWSAFRYGRGPAVWSCVLAVSLFDLLFIPPFGTLAVSDIRYIATFGVMMAIGLLISDLTSRLRAQVENARIRERRTTSLYELGKRLSALYGTVFLVNAAAAKFMEQTGGQVAIYLRSDSVEPEVAFGRDGEIARHPLSLGTALWSMDNRQAAGAGTNTLPSAIALFLPLIGSHRALGSIAIRVADPQRLNDPEERRFLEASAAQLALALERDELAIDAAEAHVQAETEKVRSTLLSSVSHDLKTPLAAIAGAAESLLQTDFNFDPTHRQLLETISEESVRLHRLLENILQMSRLDAGAVVPNMQWHVLEEIVGSALHRTRNEIENHPVRTDLPADLPLVHVDGLLLEQLLVNLLENAARHAGPNVPITISAAVESPYLRITFADEGKGLPAGSEEAIFEKFFRGSPMADGGRGTGLGLAICRAIVKTHGGQIIARNRPGGGTQFDIRLPLGKNPPQVRIE